MAIFQFAMLVITRGYGKLECSFDHGEIIYGIILHHDMLCFFRNVSGIHVSIFPASPYLEEQTKSMGRTISWAAMDPSYTV